MNATRAGQSSHVCAEGQPRSPAAFERGPAYFDSDLKAWVLSRHADVFAAFQNSWLLPGRRNLTDLSVESEKSARLAMREEVQNALSPKRVRALREELQAHSHHLCAQLPVSEPVDLIATYGRPLCLRFAAEVTGIGLEQAEMLQEFAQIASAATADPDDPMLQARAKGANQILRASFNSGPESLRDSGFVGLSQTLLRIVSAVWHALVQFPDQWSSLRVSPESIDRGLEELLRYAGIICTLWRTAIEEVNINGAHLHKGDHVLLRMSSASHDPERYDNPDRIDCARPDPGHFLFGSGPHACVAANLNRMAAITMTLPLLTRFERADLARPVEWHGGSVMRSPGSLWVLLKSTQERGID